MRKTKSKGKTVGISQSVRKVANFAMQLRNWQGCCENSQCEISQCEISQCEIGIGIAKLKLALRNWHCEIRKGCQHIAKISALLFFLLIFNICSKICTKLLKLKQEKLHKGTN